MKNIIHFALLIGCLYSSPSYGQLVPKGGTAMFAPAPRAVLTPPPPRKQPAKASVAPQKKKATPARRPPAKKKAATTTRSRSTVRP
jgi:hypothetical protein